MSTTIDSKVVEMQFDNRDFEANVKTSMSTLERLKESLNLKDASDGLSEFGSAFGRMDLSGLSGAVESVHTKFSAFEVMAITALANITNAAIDTGKQLVASLTVDQISAGWEKFGDKTRSVGTLISQGFDMSEVEEQLERLNWFTDETSYNFTDMVGNIGKFTASGKGLTESVDAMQGIALWAALSGQNASVASRAMYQLSQAMGSGVMRKQDWMSIQNASMDTAEFRQHALDAAVALGTLKKNADGTYTSVVAGAKSSTFSIEQFADNLTQEAWFTSDVMMRVFGDYSAAVDQIYTYAEEHGITASQAIEELGDQVDAFGLKAFRAGQEARTWGDVLDSVKDAVSTGWMQTFENIFGNYEEAKQLWTDLANELYDVFAEGGNQRNEMLAAWKEMGGRDDLIDSFWNIFNGIRDIGSMIREAFRDIFPAMTSERLLEITAHLKSMTEGFANLSDKIGDNFVNTFRGLFAVFDIGKQAISALVNGLKPLLNLLPGIGGGILNLTGNMGEWLVQLDEAIKQNDIFQFAVDSIVNFLMEVPKRVSEVFKAFTGISFGEVFHWIGDKMSSALSTVKEAVEGFRNIDTSGVTSFADKIKLRFEPLGAIFDGVKRLIGGMWTFLKSLSPVFAGVATAFGNALGALGDAIHNTFVNADFNSLLDLFNGGVIAAIGLSIKKFMDNLSKLSGSANGITGSIKGLLTGVQETMESFQKSVNAKTLLTIAEAIGILTASVVVLSMIDSAKLSAALGAMTGEFAELIAAFSIMEKTTSSDGVSKLGKMALAMVGMSTAILILSSAMKKIADLDWDGVLKGLVAVAGLSATLVISAQQLSKNSGKLITGSLGLIAFAAAIKMMVGPVKELGQMDIGSLAKGLIAVGALCAELALFLKTADFDNVGIGKGIGLMAIASAILILESAVSKMAALDFGKMIQGLVGLGAVLAEIVVFTKFTGNTSGIMSTAAGMLVIGAAMLEFSAAVDKMGSLSLGEIIKGLVGMAGALTIAAVAVNAFPKSTAITAAGLVVMGVALKTIANAVQDFGSMQWGEIARGLTVMAGALLEVVVATNAMTGALPGAAALLVVSGALAIFAPVLKSLGGMSWGEIGKGLITLAGAFTVIGVAGALITPIVPGLLGLAGAISLLGVGALACGAGILALSAGISALAVAGTAGITALTLAIEAIIGLIPAIAVRVGEGIVELISTIGSSAVKIAEAAVNIVSAVLIALKGTIPQLVTFVVEFIDTTLSALAAHMPSIVKAGYEIILALMKGLRDNIGELVSTAADIVLNMIDAISQKIPEFVQAGYDFIVNFVDGLANGIEENTPRIIEAFEHLGSAILKSFLAFFGIHSPSTVMADAGGNMVAGLVEGISNNEGLSLDAILDLGKKMLSKIGEVIPDFLKKGYDVMSNLGTGIKNKFNEVTGATKDVVSGVLTSISSKAGEFMSNGKEAMSKLQNGISNGLSGAKDAMSNVMTNVISTITSKLSQFTTNGRTAMTNFQSGISGMLSSVRSAATNIGQNVVSAVSGFAGSFSSIGSNMMSGLRNGIQSMASSIVSAARGVVSNAISAAKNLLGIHSPSRVFAEIGRFTDMGLVQGLEQYASRVYSASEGVGEKVVDGASNTLSGVSDLLFDDGDPTIHPVLDLSDIMSGAKKIEDLLFGQHSIDLANSTNLKMGEVIAKNQNGMKVNNTDIVGEITKLRADVSSLSRIMSNLKVVMDTGTLVGALVDPMDNALGMKAIYSGRGN